MALDVTTARSGVLADLHLRRRGDAEPRRQRLVLVRELDGALAGVTRPAGRQLQRDGGLGRALVPLVTVTWISRSTPRFGRRLRDRNHRQRAASPRTENAGTTFSSMRLSPM